jgi:hypothetical protein
MRSLCHHQYARYSQSANYARFAPNAPVSQSPPQPEDSPQVALSVCSYRPHARGANIEHCTTDAHSVTDERAAWTAAIELGASNGQAMVKKPGGQWELVRWAQGVSASSVGGAEAIPALTAIRKQGQPREVLHGHAAVRARKRNPGDWEMFAYPKLVFIEEETTPEIQRTLELQKEKAKAFGMTSKEVAVAFFRHMISEVIGQRDETFKIYMNISDRWPNSNVQELMLSLQGLGADAQFEHVDECLSSIIGRISSSAGSVSAGGVYVVVDCGHSGMVRSRGWKHSFAKLIP